MQLALSGNCEEYALIQFLFITWLLVKLGIFITDNNVELNSPKIPSNVSVTLAFSGSDRDWPKAVELQKRYTRFYPLKRPNILSIISRVSWAICAGGVTLLEASAMGISCSVIITAENQFIGASSLEALGGAQVAYDLDSAVTQTLDRINEPSVHEKIAGRARALVDGDGPARVVDAMENLTKLSVD